MWQYNYTDVDHDELYHYGRKGMKWYQNIYTKGKNAIASRKQRKLEKEAAKKEALKKKILESRSVRELDKNANLFSKQELDAAYDRLRREQDIRNLAPKQNPNDNIPSDPKIIALRKEEIIRSGNAREIFANSHLFTTQELNDAQQRLGYLSQIQSKIPVEESKGKKFMDSLPDNLDKAVKITNSSIDLYNNVARTLTAFTGVEVPVVGDTKAVWGNQSKQKADAKKADKEAEEKRVKEEAEAAKKQREDAEKLKNAQKQVDEYNAKREQDYYTESENARMHSTANAERRNKTQSTSNQTNDTSSESELKVVGYLPPNKAKATNDYILSLPASTQTTKTPIDLDKLFDSK